MSRLGALLLTALLAAPGCGGSETDRTLPGTSEGTADGPDWLHEVTTDWGVDFRHESGATGKLFYREMGGSGGALLDADEDGRLDLYLINGSHGPGQVDEAIVNRLYLQTSPGRFEDATARSGAADPGYGTGCAAADVNNDGHVDLYAGNLGPDRLFLGRGDGTFEDVTATSGIDCDGWSTSVAFLDYDADGWLDLYVARYVIPTDRVCRDAAGRPEFCNPAAYSPVPDQLYHNRGDGTFEDVSEEHGIPAIARRGLGALAADVNGDGWTDVFVANDGEENHLWINREGQGFEDRGLLAGVALNRSGKPEASMGIALGDVDGDGDLDLFTTHLRHETNTLYRNLGSGSFEDWTVQSGLGAISVSYTGFGTAFLDLDCDSHLDAVVVNGRVVRGQNLVRKPQHPFWDDYAEPNLLFRGLGDARFEDISPANPEFCALPEVSRGLLAGDLDNDGDLDLVVTNIHGPARLLQNDARRRGATLQVLAYDPRLQRAVYGAHVAVELPDGRVLHRELNPGASYQSSGDARCHFGLGSTESYASISVRWPGGESERFPGGAANQSLVLRRGEGQPQR